MRSQGDELVHCGQGVLQMQTSKSFL